MESTPRWGITLPLRTMPLPEQRDLVAALPDLGYTDAWSSEVNGADAFTPLAAAALWTTGLRFGTAIAGIYTRGRSSAGSSVAVNFSTRRPTRNSPPPATRMLRTHCVFPRGEIRYRSPSRVSGFTGVVRHSPDLRPRTASTREP